MAQRFLFIKINHHMPSTEIMSPSIGISEIIILTGLPQNTHTQEDKDGKKIKKIK
jgi:hypothetical protein